MDEKATSYIESLALNSGENKTQDTWYCIAACAFTACNQGKYVADIFRIATESHAKDTEKHKFLLLRIKGLSNSLHKCKIRDLPGQTSLESLLKTGIIYGIPRLINAFRSLITAIPSPSSNEISSIRNQIENTSSTDDRGLAYMRNIFRADLDPFLTTMDKHWPDLRTLVVTTIYGYYQSEVSIIDAVTTSQLNIVTLVAMDVPNEVAWHMRGLMRNGGSTEELDFALGIAEKVVEICEVGLRNVLPRAEDVVDEETLF